MAEELYKKETFNGDLWEIAGLTHPPKRLYLQPSVTMSGEFDTRSVCFYGFYLGVWGLSSLVFFHLVSEKYLYYYTILPLPLLK